MRITYLKWKARKQARDTVNGLTASAVAFKVLFPDCHLASDYAKMALAKRPGWKQLNESEFEHASGLVNTIGTGDTLLMVAREVVGIELAIEYSGHPFGLDLLGTALAEIDRIQKQHRDSNRH